MKASFDALPDQRHSRADAWHDTASGGASPASIIQAPCALILDTAPATARPTPTPKVPRHRSAGFTLIELLAVVSMVGTLSTIALPSFEGQLQRARRSDVLVTMMQVQAAQERWRGNGASYGSLTDIGTPAVSAAGHYRLELRSADEDGYDVLASATGMQARDAACRHMALRMVGANPVYASGPDASVSNLAPANAKCWSL